jgi:hypothetical protein
MSSEELLSYKNMRESEGSTQYRVPSTQFNLRREDEF